MTSTELLPAAVLTGKAVVYIRQSTQVQVQSNLENRPWCGRAPPAVVYKRAGPLPFNTRSRDGRPRRCGSRGSCVNALRHYLRCSRTDVVAAVHDPQVDRVAVRR
jgi:hypothetical protein